MPFPLIKDDYGGEVRTASTSADESGAHLHQLISEPMVLVEGGGQEQTNASTGPGANECINCTSPSIAATCHIYPKHSEHFFALPIRPNTAFAAGGSIDPHVHHAHSDTLLSGFTLWALLRWVLTTTIGSEGCVEDVDAVEDVFFTSNAGVLGAIVGGGVPGNAICCIAGVAGAGKQPSAAGRHPARSASEMVFRVWSSVTHAAALYLPGIFEPFFQCPRLSSERSVSSPRGASWVPAVTWTWRHPWSVYSITVSGLSPPYTMSNKWRDLLKSS